MKRYIKKAPLVILATSLLMLSVNSYANRVFIQNDCHCDRYLTIFEKGLQEHHKRLELWIPQGGLRILDVQTQEVNLRGAPAYSMDLTIQNHYGDTFEKTLAKDHAPECRLNYNVDGSVKEEFCNLY